MHIEIEPSNPLICCWVQQYHTHFRTLFDNKRIIDELFQVFLPLLSLLVPSILSLNHFINILRRTLGVQYLIAWSDTA